MSSDKKSKIPEVPIPAAGTGNILSSVAPPSELPNFITASPVKISPVPPINPQHVPPPSKSIAPKENPELDGPQQTTLLTEPEQQKRETFSPVIPLSKGEPTHSIQSPEDSQATQTPDSTPSTSEIDKIGDVRPGSGILTWVKGAVSTGGILHQVVEKAKSSVDTMITTLDPQMKEMYLNSGGDVSVVVASDKEIEISAVRQAFQGVFGKATVVGCAAQSAGAAQPVGYAAACAAAKQRIAHARALAHLPDSVPVLALESFIHEPIADRWYEYSVVVLSQPSLGVELHAQSQGAALPAGAAAAARARTPAQYEHAHTGYSVTVGEVIAETLQVPVDAWHEATCGVPRREALSLAARALAGAYSRVLSPSAGEP